MFFILGLRIGYRSELEEEMVKFKILFIKGGVGEVLWGEERKNDFL